jgi:hypothetical protein
MLGWSSDIFPQQDWDFTPCFRIGDTLKVMKIATIALAIATTFVGAPAARAHTGFLAPIALNCGGQKVVCTKVGGHLVCHCDGPITG